MRLVRAILMGAINANTSDIHLEPHEPEMRVRYRVDGELQAVMTIPNHIEEAVVARIKVMADMDTTENRRPQDGHLSVQEAGTQGELPRQHDSHRRRRKGRDAAARRRQQDRSSSSTWACANATSRPFKR